jgi:16S rRNA processing protein RimM
VSARAGSDADGPSPDGDVVAVGRVGRAHGVRGDVIVESWTDAPGERFAVGTAIRTDPGDRGPLTVEAVKEHSGRLVVHFFGVDDRTAAEAIRGTMLVVDTSERPDLDDPDEFYDTDLVGLLVQATDGATLGPVLDVLHTPAGSLLVIDNAGRELLVPFRREIVPTVDLGGGRIVAALPDGLLEL